MTKSGEQTRKGLRMKIEKIYLDWDSVESFQSEGEDKCILFLTNGRRIQVKHSFDELLEIKNSFTLDSKVVLNLIATERESKQEGIS